ncbi:hypothetical protein WJX84_011049 [Apatococcus fuscideae]|uniref:Prefoldin subunit 5 n=1 Tax=Apatococcus fuscideae TaxID=2026836 RepID=A0AAW1RFL9_9CHLO
MTSKEPQTIDLKTIEPQQLNGLREQLEAEMQNLSASATALQSAAGQFGSSGRAIERLAQQEAGQPMLMPLTSSLYIPATLDSTANVLIDIGASYYVERSPPDGAEYCKRKVNMLKDQLDQIGQAMRDKQRVLQQVTAVLQQKLAASRAQQS